MGAGRKASWQPCCIKELLRTAEVGSCCYTLLEPCPCRVWQICQQHVLRESVQEVLNSPPCRHRHTTPRSAAVITMPAVCCFGQAQMLFQLTQIHGKCEGARLAPLTLDHLCLVPASDSSFGTKGTGPGPPQAVEHRQQVLTLEKLAFLDSAARVLLQHLPGDWGANVCT